MKKSSLILVVVFLISVCASFQGVNAQEKTKEEKEKELKLQQTIEQQKKAIAEQKKAQEEQGKSLEEQQQSLENAVKEANVRVREAGRYEDAMRNFRSSGARSFSFDEPNVISPGLNFYGFSTGGDGEKTTWEFSKSVKETTFSKNYSFDVEASVSTVVMSVNGDCKAGEIHIKIIMPSGKTYSDIVIDEFGNLNWRKSFTISDTENKDKAGEWKFGIDASKATGFFKISLQTY
jgi:ATPase subunit of ABC transporter with duplicated ATPase domains